MKNHSHWRRTRAHANPGMLQIASRMCSSKAKGTRTPSPTGPDLACRDGGGFTEPVIGALAAERCEPSPATSVTINLETRPRLLQRVARGPGHDVRPRVS